MSDIKAACLLGTNCSESVMSNMGVCYHSRSIQALEAGNHWHGAAGASRPDPTPQSSAYCRMYYAVL